VSNANAGVFQPVGAYQEGCPGAFGNRTTKQLPGLAPVGLRQGLHYRGAKSGTLHLASDYFVEGVVGQNPT